jgi:hypothetical protein
MVPVQKEPINKEVQMIKESFDKKYNEMLKASEEKTNNQVATGDDKKDTKTKQKYLTPPIKASQATFYADNNYLLARSCSIKAEDIILTNKINVKVKEDIVEGKSENNKSPDISNIINSIEKSIVDISYMCEDYELNGAGCCKITKFEDDDEFRLTQLPQESVQILKISDEKLQDTPIYLVEQEVGNGKKYYKILGEVYPENYDTYEKQELGLVWWIGGDKSYNFYRKPVWFATRSLLDTQIALNSFDTENVQNGFNMNTVLFFNKESSYIPYPPNVDEGNNDEKDEGSDVEPTENNDYYKYLAAMAQNVGAETIAKELKAAGYGVAVLYEETENPLTMQQATLSNTNYDYLETKSKQADQAIISVYGIPRERYMINDIKESMNSNKTASFWEIYTNVLNAQQKPYEIGLVEIIDECYDLTFEVLVDIEVPMFSALIDAKIERVSNLFLKGLLPLGKTIGLLMQYITELDINDLDLTNPIYEMRFFNGNPLGGLQLTTDQQIEYDNVVSSFIS